MLLETKYSVKKSTLDAIADAIQEKTGNDETLTPSDMAEAIPDVFEAGRKSLDEELLNGAW